MTNLNTEALTQKSSPRWGIFSLAVVMFLVTTIGGIGGKPNGFYLAVWVLVAYYAYRGSTTAVYGWVKTFLIANVVLIGGLAIVSPNIVWNYLAVESVGRLTLGWLIPLFVGISLFLYLVWEKPEEVNKQISSNLSQASTPIPSASRLHKSEPQPRTDSMEAAYLAAYELPKASQDAIKSPSFNDSTPSKPTAEEEESAYEQAGDEIHKETYRRGLWTRLWAENDGDEKKVKVAYIKLRVPQILEEKSQAKAENLKAALAENLASEREQAYQDELAVVRIREGSAAATRLHISELMRSPDFRAQLPKLLSDVKRFRESSESRIRLLRYLGGKFDWDSRNILMGGSIVTFAGSTQTFVTLETFCDWVDQAIVSDVERVLAADSE